jgi:GT2 family glycosyltransferase/tetratricopeptide (TPR) repeat protein
MTWRDALKQIPASARRVLVVGENRRHGHPLTELIRERADIDLTRFDSDDAFARGNPVAPARDVNLESGAPFDAIVCETLDQTREPERLLRLFHKRLAPDGTLIVGAPNVGREEVIRDLLGGCWQSAAKDDAPVRYFTKRELEKLLYRAGFRMVEVSPVPGTEVRRAAGFIPPGPGVRADRPEFPARPSSEASFADAQAAQSDVGRRERDPAGINRAARFRETAPGATQTGGASEAFDAEASAARFIAVAKREDPPAYAMTSIVIVTHNELAHTQRCLDSIALRTDEPYELIVVDNGSSDGTVEYLRGLCATRTPALHPPFPPGRGVETEAGAQMPSPLTPGPSPGGRGEKVFGGETGELLSRPSPAASLGRCVSASLIENAQNRGFPAAANQGIRAARGENVLLLNNDTIVTTGWLRRQLDALHSAPEIGLVGPCSNNVSGSQQVAVSYDDLGGLDGFAWELGKKCGRQRVSSNRLVGFCLLIKREVIERIGVFDERFGIGNFEDDDFCRRALQAGYKAVIAADAFVHHIGHATFRGAEVDLARLLGENRRIYEEKWAARSEVPSGPSPGPPWPPLAQGGNAGESQIGNPKSEISLSLCMIVRDNETTIGPCLASIRPWVDEIIIVDTGSIDRTTQICAEFGARLHEFRWCDDFSAARNESLKSARGKWIFWMDSDDTISAECGRKLRQLADGPHADNVLGYLMQVHCPGFDDDGQRQETAVDQLKLVRNRPNLKFEGRIHEQLIPAIRRAGGEIVWADIYVMHSGADHSPAAFQRKLQRDLRILHLELAEKPDHPFVLFNLGMTYADAKRFDEAIDYLKRCLKVSTPDQSQLRKAYAILVSALNNTKRYDEAWATCERGRALYQDDKELLFRSAMLHHHFGRLADAEAAYLQVLGGHEERHFTSIDRELAGDKARHNLAIVYDDMGRFERAAEQWRLILRHDPDYIAAWHGLGLALLKQKNESEVAALVEQMLSRPQTRTAGRVLEGRLCVQRGDCAAARRALETALRESSRAAEPLQELCKLLFEHAAPGEAEAVLHQLTELKPKDAAAWHNLGTVQCQLGKFGEACVSYRKSLALRPGYEPTITHLGFAAQRARGPERTRRCPV